MASVKILGFISVLSVRVGLVLIPHFRNSVAYRRRSLCLGLHKVRASIA